MHRSGTSALTRVLASLGCDLPNTLMEADSNNSMGYWESTEIANLNDEILDSAGSSWDDWEAFNPEWYASVVAEDFRGRARAVLGNEFEDSRLFVLKDPRICRLLQFWKEALDGIGVVPVVALPVRNPLEVAESLRVRDKIDPSIGVLIWLRNVLDAEADSRGSPRAFIRYADLLTDWKSLAIRLGSELEVAWPRQSTTTELEIGSFVAPAIRHHAYDDARVHDDPLISRWVKTVFEVLNRWAVGEVQRADAGTLDTVRLAFNDAVQTFSRPIAISRRVMQINREYETQVSTLDSTARSLEEAVDARDRQIADLDRAVRERDQLISDQDGRLASMGETLSERDAEVADRDGRLASMSEALSERDAEVADRDGRLASMSEALSERDAEVADRDGRIASLNEALSDRDGRLASMSETLSERDAEVADRDSRLASMSETLSERDAEVADRDGRLASLNETLSERDAEIADRNSRLASMSEALSERDAEVADRDGRLASMSEALSERDAEVADRDGRLASLSETLSERDAEVADRDGRLASLSERLSERDAQVAELNHRIESLQDTIGQRDRAIVERDSQIESIQESISWRVTRPLRSLKAALRGALVRLLPPGLSDRRLRTKSPRKYVASGRLELADRNFDAATNQGDTPVVFDPEYYRATNEEVMTSGEDPLRHYLKKGAIEGRLPFAFEPDEVDPVVEALHRIDLRQDQVFEFDARFYRDLNPDVNEADGERLLDHYQKHGRAESRAASAGEFVRQICDDPREIPLDFKATEYIDLYPDLIAYADRSPLEALRHYMSHGRWEPRLYTARGDPGTTSSSDQGSIDMPAEMASEPKPLCVLVHMYYPELWEELAGYIANLPEKAFDLYVNLVDTTFTEAIEQRIRDDFPAASIYVSENIGRDIGGYFQLLRNVPMEEYRFFCLIHSKKSPHLAMGDALLWRRRLLFPLLGTRELAVDNLRLMLADETIGLIGAGRCRDTELRDNAEKFTELLDLLDVRPEFRDVEFLGGTMMYLRREILQRIFQTCKDLPFEKGDDTTLSFHLDAQWAHAIERVIGNVVRDMNYRFEWR